MGNSKVSQWLWIYCILNSFFSVLVEHWFQRGSGSISIILNLACNTSNFGHLWNWIYYWAIFRPLNITLAAFLVAWWPLKFYQTHTSVPEVDSSIGLPPAFLFKNSFSDLNKVSLCSSSRKFYWDILRSMHSSAPLVMFRLFKKKSSRIPQGVYSGSTIGYPTEIPSVSFWHSLLSFFKDFSSGIRPETPKGIFMGFLIKIICSVGCLRDF